MKTFGYKTCLHCGKEDYGNFNYIAIDSLKENVINEIDNIKFKNQDNTNYVIKDIIKIIKEKTYCGELLPSTDYNFDETYNNNFMDGANKLSSIVLDEINKKYNIDKVD